METSAISYRVADFLKQHPPFHAVDEADLLELAQRGRVRFHEANEYILWQGEPNRMQVFVIQQGTVSLWDEAAESAQLRDVRGVGDLLGIEPFSGADAYLHSARSSTDVVLYAFSALDFEELVLKHQYASRYIAAYGTVTTDYQPLDERRDPQRVFLHDCFDARRLQTCDVSTPVRDAARRLLATGTDALAVTDGARRIRGVFTPASLLEWLASGGGDVSHPISDLLADPPPAVSVDASVTDGILAMGAANTDFLPLTTDGTLEGELQGLVTARDLLPVFGDQPSAILQAIHRATDVDALRDLNRRARAFALQSLAGPRAVDWVTRFTHLADVNILRRVISMTDTDDASVCWCLCGAAGRSESLPALAPGIVMLVDDHANVARALASFTHVVRALPRLDYLPETDNPFEPSFLIAHVDEWRQRFRDWIRDPVLKEAHRARPLFDLRPISGSPRLWQQLESAVTPEVDTAFLHVLAHDCLANLPPLTFFQDVVVDESGEASAIFRLARSALQPLVDVGRVFGLAGRALFGRSTLERFATARALLPEQASIFHEASETMRIVLWQQGRVGISQGTTGTELPPALLSRYDRQMLKSGFTSILRLLEFTADMRWLKTL